MTTTSASADLIADAHKFLSDPAFRADPDDFYLRLLAEDRVLPIGGGYWLVSGHAEITQALRDTRFSRAESAKTELRVLDTADDEDVRYAGECVHQMSLMLDPPEHTKIRKLQRDPFLPSTVKRYEPFLRDLVAELIADFPRQGVFDLKAKFTLPIPERAICMILGVPHEDHELFEHWTIELVRMDRTGHASDEQLRPGRDAYAEFTRYCKELIAQRRAAPGDDLISVLVQASEDGDRLTDEELNGNLQLLIAAGHETTANTTASAVMLLMEHRDQWDKLVADPSLARGAIEETLRLRGAQRFSVPRVALEDVPLGDKVIPAGERILPITHAANRDPLVFQDPLAFDITRDPNPHVAFGNGHHLCLGMNLARLEMIVALEGLVRSCPGLELAVDPSEIEITDGPTILGVSSVPVRLG
jgi:cytochrome P450